MLADWQITEMGIVTPCAPSKKRQNTLSYGAESYGYNCRVGYTFKIFTSAHSKTIDPKNFDNLNFIEKNAISDGKEHYIIIPPHSFALAETLEVFDIPRGYIGLVTNKSTYARCGLIQPSTVLEPCWRGTITLELINVTPLPIKVYCGEGIAQIIFFKGEELCAISYTDKGGVYSDQSGIQNPKVR